MRREGIERVVSNERRCKPLGTVTCLWTLDDIESVRVQRAVDGPPTEEQRDRLEGYVGSVQTRAEARALLMAWDVADYEYVRTRIRRRRQ